MSLRGGLSETSGDVDPNELDLATWRTIYALKDSLYLRAGGVIVNRIAELAASVDSHLGFVQHSNPARVAIAAAAFKSVRSGYESFKGSRESEADAFERQEELEELREIETGTSR